MAVLWKIHAGTLLICALTCGCGGSPESAPPESALSIAQVVDTSALPKLADPIPRLDDGRVDIAPPEGWHVPSRSNQYIVRFQRKVGSSYPTILVTAEDLAEFPDLSLSAKNVNAWSGSASKQSGASVETVKIDRFVGVTYRKQGIEKNSVNKILERLFLETVVAGRKYTLELRDREDSLAETRPYLMAVARGIHFHEAPVEKSAGTQRSEPTAKPEPESKPDTASKSGTSDAKEIDKETDPSKKPKQGDWDIDLEELDLEELLK